MPENRPYGTPDTHQGGSLKLVRITHYRCGDYDCVSYALAPTEWDDDEVERHVDDAAEAYLAAVDAAAKGANKVAYPHPPQITAEGLDATATIAEVRAAFEERKRAYEQAEEAQRYTARSFEDFLTDQGFVSLWSDDAQAVKAEVQWGHRHGQRLRYGNDHALDAWPSPKKLHALLNGALAEDYDDEDFG